MVRPSHKSNPTKSTPNTAERERTVHERVRRRRAVAPTANDIKSSPTSPDKNDKDRLERLKKAPRGNKNALKDGLYTREAIEERRQLRTLLQQSQALIKRLANPSGESGASTLD